MKRLTKEGKQIMETVMDCKDFSEMREYYPNKSNEDLTVALNSFGKLTCGDMQESIDMFFAGMKWQREKDRKKKV